MWFSNGLVAAKKTPHPEKNKPVFAYNQPMKKYPTTNQQPIANAEPKTERLSAPASLMMSVAATPLSNCLKTKNQTLPTY
jgi:hypothetical protein